jgi:hypothetical protein
MSAPTTNVNDLLETSPEELSRLIDQPDMPAILTDLFQNRQVSLALLREYSFLTIGMNRLQRDMHHLRQEMHRHINERTDLFRLLTNNQHVQETLFPLLDHFRQQQQQESSPSSRASSPEDPVLFVPADGTIPTLTEITEYMDDTLQTLSSHDSPRTVEIHSSPPNDNTSLTPDTAPPSFQTANENPLGSPFNPIDVDLIPDHLVRLNTGMRRSRSTLSPTYCQTCQRYGHTATNCIWVGPIVCGYCMEIGHGRRNCHAHRRDASMYNPHYNFCLLCSQTGHTIVQCMSLQYPG